MTIKFTRMIFIRKFIGVGMTTIAVMILLSIIAGLKIIIKDI